MFWDSIHPAVAVTAGFFCVIVAQSVTDVYLPIVAVGFCLAAIAFAPTKFRQVLRRTKYVILAIAVLFAWQTPGTLLVPGLGVISPTLDGCRAAIIPIERLAATIAIVSVLLERLSAEQWVSSLYVLIAPFRSAGFAERFAVRLRLVIDYVEARKLDWRTNLAATALEDIPSGGEQWGIVTLRFADKVLLILLVLAMWGVIWLD